MLQNILYAIVLVLIVIIILGIIKKVFSIFVKIAVLILVLIFVVGAFTYLDLARNDLIGETALVFVGEETLNGIILEKDSPQERLGDVELELIKKSLSKNYSSFEFEESVEFNHSVKLWVFVEGNYTDSSNYLEGTKFETVLDIIKFFKNENIYFFPKTTSTTIIEKLRN